MSRAKETQKHFDKQIKKYGWAAHYVPYDDYHINYHTHGLYEKYKHHDFQITLPVSAENAHGIIHGLIEDVKKGQKFEVNLDYIGYLGSGYRIQFKQFVECGRPVLRLLFPDKNGKMPFDSDCDKYFKMQLDVLDD